MPDHRKKVIKAVEEDWVRCQVCGRSYVAITPAHLRTHGVSTADYRDAYGAFSFYSLSLRRRLSELCRGRSGLKQPRAVYVPRMPEDVIADLRRYARGRQLPGGRLRQMDASLARQVARLFTSWGAAMTASKLPYSPKRKWDRQSVGAALRRWAKEHHGLASGELQDGDGGLSYALYKCFGSPQKAAKALGVPLRIERRSWTKKQVLAEVRRLIEHGASLSAGQAARRDYSLYRGARKLFGTWAGAVTAAGFDYGPWRRKRGWDSRTVGGALRTWVQENGPLSGAALQASDRGLYGAVIRYCGSVSQAAERYGLPYRPKHLSWTAKKVLDGIRARLRRGEPVNSNRVQTVDRKLYKAAVWYHGGWARALAAAGVLRNARSVR